MNFMLNEETEDDSFIKTILANKNMGTCAEDSYEINDSWWSKQKVVEPPLVKQNYKIPIPGTKPRHLQYVN